MTKKLLLLLFTMTLLLVACAQVSQPEATPQASPTPEVQATEALGCPEPEKEPACTVGDRRPTPNPTMQAFFPAPHAQDWIKGPEDAYITLIEYGDFQ